MPLPQLSMEATAVADPELRFAQSGVAVARLRCVASGRKFNKDKNEWEDGDQLWIDVTCFKTLAENVAETVLKGQRVLVTGKIKTEEWTDKDTGDKRSKVVLIADSVGPALNFASAKVVKAERSGGAAAAPAADDPWASPPAGDEPPF